MQAPDPTILRDIVLVGGGHSHVGVLKSFGMRPIPGVRLTLICTDMHTPYSGMLPGYVAGHYDYDQVHIDLSRLAAFSGTRLYHDEVIGLDRDARKVLCRKHPPVPYDVLSINIGSTPQLRGVPGAPEHAIAVKPITRFNQRWLALLDRIQHHPGTTTVAVVGAGAGGVELLLAMQFRLRNELRLLGRNPDELVFHLFTSNQHILPTHNAWVRQHFDKVLTQRQVQVHRNAAVNQVLPGRLQTSDGKFVDADEIVWVTRAGGAAWLQDTGLTLDEEGFILVNDYLQCMNDPNIFAAGDIANMVNYPLEKAGVFAVRQGPPLTENLRLSVANKALTPYYPQQRWLALISTGDKYAVASRGWLGFAGTLVWRWKDWIDQRFMRKFTDLTPMQEDIPALGSAVQLNVEESAQALSVLGMRCGGCGAKVGADVLSRALSQLKPVQRDDVVIGLADPDDAAVVRVPPGKAMVHTVDFFRTCLDDPYLFGRVAANHALGDIWAMGAEPQSATAIATVPAGLDRKLEDLLFQMMTGALEVLNEANCALVGGHTAEGKELALGFAINGLIDDDPARILRKSGMRPGNVLILTKPIGTGALFASYTRLAAKGRWVEAALASIQVSSRDAAQIFREFGVTACTDLTGFGLIGHLVEMTRPSGVDAEINLSALPVLAGTLEVMAEGIFSSLHGANLRMSSALRNRAEMEPHPRYPLLFDPQTAGGLLASVPAEWAEACIAALRERGYAHAVVIGRVLPQGEALEPIVLCA
jgi:selenide, water dikinase